MPDSSVRRLIDAAIELLVSGLLVWLPFAFGGVEPSSHEIIILAAGLVGLLLAARLLTATADGPVRWSWAFVPLLAYVGLVALQLVPLPLSTLDGLAPTTAQTWRDLLSAPPLEGGPPTHGTLSLYPHGTAEDLRVLLAGFVLFAAGVILYRDSGRLKRLLILTVACGAAVAGIGVLQIVTDAVGIYWVEGWGNKHPTAGPFRHYGHYSQYLNLCIGAGIGLVLMRLSERTGRDRFDAVELLADLRAPERRTELLVVAFVAVAMVAVAMSRSRNGVLSLLVGGATMAACMQGSRFARGMSWPLLALVVVAFCTLLVFGFDPVYERMSTLGEVDEAYSGRLAILEDTMAMVSQYSAWGVGQGAFEYAFPGFDTSVRGGRAEHAENQYAEVLAESGAVGAAVVVVFLTIVVFTVGRRMWRRAEPADSVLFGLGLGVVAVGFHALTDFGLRIPAVAALLAVFLGAACGRAGSSLGAGRFARAVPALVLAAVAIALWITVPAADRARIAYSHEQQAAEIEEALRDDPTGADAVPEIADEAVRDAFQQRLEHLQAAAELVPGHVEYRLEAALADWTLEVADALGYGEEAEGEELSPDNTPGLVPAAERIQDALLEARQACPTYGLLWSMAGQLAVVWLGDPEGEVWIERGLAFAPQNPGACIASGRQALRQNDDAAAAHAFRRALAVGTPWPELYELLVLEVARPDVAREVVRGNAMLLVNLDDRLRDLARGNEAGIAELADEIRAEARALMEARSREPEAPPWMLQRLGGYALDAGAVDEAISYYQRFLGRAPNHGLRLKLAQLYYDQGDRERAIQEADHMLRLNPGHDGATNLRQKWRSGR